MKNEYIVDNEYLKNKGLNLSEYALDESYEMPIINKALDICITRCCALNDNFDKGEKSIEEELDKDVANDNDLGLVKSFKKLQYTVLYNLIFTTERSPIDRYVDDIIVFELHWGKINGIQKGISYKYN